MSKPSIAGLLRASGQTTFTTEWVVRAVNTLYGNIGAGLDERDWDAILAEADPLRAAEDALVAMYQDTAFLRRNADHLSDNYSAAQIEYTYRQIADRLNFTHSAEWAAGTRYEAVAGLSDAALLARARRDADGGDGNGGNGNTLIGTAGNDTLTGGAGDDTLSGEAGDDTLTGGGGADELFGGDGNDTLNGDVEDTEFNGGAGNDTLQFAADFDFDALVHDFTGIERIELMADGLTLDLSGNLFLDADLVGFAAGASTITGSGGPEVITGGTGDDVLRGNSGSDTLTGGGGNDTLTGDAGNDRFNVDAGSDEITDLSDSDVVVISDGASVSADVSLDYTATAASRNLGGAAEDAVFTVEGTPQTVDFSAFTVANAATQGITVNLEGRLSAITVTGTAGNDSITAGQPFLPVTQTLNGGAGDDEITGNSGADNINGDAGNDTLIGRGGADALDGGDGVDTASYAGSAAAVTVDLTDNDNNANGDAEGDTLTDIENLTGSDNDDTLRGDAGNNTLAGGAGSDTLTGAAGADTLAGGAGADTFSFNAVVGVSSDSNGAATDTIDDYAVGVDGLRLVASSVNDFNVATDVYGGAGGIAAANTYGADLNGDGDLADNGDLVVNTTGVDLTDAQARAALTVDLTGTANADVLGGGAGDDTLRGGAGADTLTGGAGSDTFVLQTTQALNGEDTLTAGDLTLGPAGANSDVIEFDFGDGGLANQAALRGDGTLAQEAENGDPLFDDVGFVVSLEDVADATVAETTAEALGDGTSDPANGDIIYFLTSTDYDNTEGDLSLYAVTYTGPDAASLELLMTANDVALNAITSANLADFVFI
mgnify:CR=1 FL=1